MASRQPSLLARALEPFAAGLWTLFLVWTAIIAVVWIGEIGDSAVQQSVTNPGLRSALQLLLKYLDAAWFAIAAANVYLALVEEECLAVARRWAVVVIFGAWLVAALSEWTGYPLGPIHYTTRLGMRIGPVPFGLLLMWFTFVIGARVCAMRFARRAAHWQISLAAAGLVGATAANLEPLAWRFRAFWLWPPDSVSVPAFAQNIATWFLASWGFAFLMRETRVASHTFQGVPRAAVIVLIFNAVFLATHLARLIRA